jgi:hypothetical protein
MRKERFECCNYNVLHCIVTDAQCQGFELNNIVLFDLFLDAKYLSEYADRDGIVYLCINRASTFIITKDRNDYKECMVKSDAFCYKVSKIEDENYDYLVERVTRKEIKF